MNISCHSLVEDPKSNESSSSGIIFESTSALNTTLSVAASPSVIVPLLAAILNFVEELVVSVILNIPLSF